MWSGRPHGSMHGCVVVVLLPGPDAAVARELVAPIRQLAGRLAGRRRHRQQLAEGERVHHVLAGAVQQVGTARASTPDLSPARGEGRLNTSPGAQAGAGVQASRDQWLPPSPLSYVAKSAHSSVPGSAPRRR